MIPHRTDTTEQSLHELKADGSMAYHPLFFSLSYSHVDVFLD